MNAGQRDKTEMLIGVHRRLSAANFFYTNWYTPGTGSGGTGNAAL